ncbi:MAG TPA: NAD(P)-dependent oxidoreductase [Candidatus Nanoarchaeia archaeon]|nr:NAD(P)-dependent oxidoreductase [Candidatus Nanoarchaeia archaeon]
MQHILITGGAGYLGSVIIGHLLEKGYKVTCIDDLRYGQKSIATYASNPQFDFIYADVRDKKTMEKAMQTADIIIPLAAIVGMPACDLHPIDAQTINIDAIKLIEEFRKPHQKIIYPTTNSGYGTKSGAQFCTEETPLEPISLYGTSKVEAERLLLASPHKAITLRLATVFGVSPRMRIDLLVNDFVWKAMHDGYIVIYEKDFKRNYVHVKDVARCFEHCILNYESMKGNAFNVGLEDANLSKAELAEKIKKYIPKFEIIYMEVGEDPDQRNYIVSNAKIAKTGFKASTTIEQGIEELMKSYKILQRNNPLKNI